MRYITPLSIVIIAGLGMSGCSMLGDAPSQTLCADNDGKYYDCMQAAKASKPDTPTQMAPHIANDTTVRWHLIADYTEQMANRLQLNLNQQSLHQPVQIRSFLTQRSNDPLLLQLKHQLKQAFLVSLQRQGWPVMALQNQPQPTAGSEKDYWGLVADGKTSGPGYRLGGAISQDPQGMTANVYLTRIKDNVVVVATSALLPKLLFGELPG